MKHSFYFQKAVLLWLILLASAVMYAQSSSSLKVAYQYADSVEFDRFIYADAQAGVLEYQFQVQQTDSNINEVLLSPVPYFCLNELQAPRVYNGDYSVRVRCIYASDTSAWGASTTFTSIPAKQYKYGKITAELYPENLYLIHAGDGDIEIQDNNFFSVAGAAGISGVRYSMPHMAGMDAGLSRLLDIYFPETFSSDSLSDMLMGTGLFKQISKIRYGKYCPSPINDPLYASADPGDPECYNCSPEYQYYMSQVDANAAIMTIWSGASSEPVDVAVIDNAIQIDHEDLMHNIYVNQEELPSGAIDFDGDGYISVEELLDQYGGTKPSDLLAPGSPLIDNEDDDLNFGVDDIFGWDISNDNNNPQPPLADDNWSHGTHVTGLAGAETWNNTGMASLSINKARILPVKISPDNSTTMEFLLDDLRDGIDYAIAMDVDIINLSLGAPSGDISIENQIQYIMDNTNIIVIAAAGNEPGDDVHYPAAYGGVVGVAAAAPNGTTPAYFTTHGDSVDVVAPGTGILSTIVHPDPDIKYGCKDGTSMATPIVSSMYAFLLSKMPELTREQLNDCVFNSCIQGSFSPVEYGHGMINAYDAYDCLRDVLNADIETDYEITCTNNSIHLVDVSTGVSPQAWTWSCPGAPAGSFVISDPNSPETDILFNQPGDYTVQLDVSNNMNSNTAEIEIHVGHPQLTLLTPGEVSICNGEIDYAFFDLVYINPPYTVNYTFNGNAFVKEGTDQAFGIPLAEPGTLVINSVTGSNGCSVNPGLTVHVGDANCACRTRNNNHWVFGRNMHLTFDTPFELQDDVQTITSEGISSYSDNNGNLLFYTNGQNLWEADGTVHTLYSPSYLYTPSEVLILPQPGTPDSYFLFAPANQNSSNTSPPTVNDPMYYYVLQWDPVNENVTNIVQHEMPVPSGVELIEKVTWAHKADSESFWIITSTDYSNGLCVFELSSSGLSPQPNNPFVFPGSYFNKRGEFALSRHEDLLAESFNRINDSGLTGSVRLYEFDNASGTFNTASYGEIQCIKGPYGLEFSPDAHYLYIGQFYGGTLQRIAVPANISNADCSSLEVIHPMPSFGAAALRRIDDIIYASVYNTDYLGVIANTDTEDPAFDAQGVLIYDGGPSNGGEVLNGLPPRVPGAISEIDIVSERYGCDPCDYSAGVLPNGEILNAVWSNGDTGLTATDLCVGNTYSVTVTNSDGCTISDEISIESDYIPVEIVNAMMQGTCLSGGTIEIEVTGGTAPYHYEWENEAGTAIPGDSYELSGLQSGYYSVTVSDAEGCYTTGTFEIPEGDSPMLTASVTNATCESQPNGEIELLIDCGTPPFAINWTGGSASTSGSSYTISGLDEGSYNITVTDAGGNPGYATGNVLYAWNTAAGTVLSNTNLSGTYEGMNIKVESITGGHFVPAGQELRFSNCTVYMAADYYNDITDTRITAKNADILILNESYITSGCPQMWDGYYVSGSNTTTNGNIRVENSGMANAMNAIKASKFAYVYASESDFLNNRVSIDKLGIEPVDAVENTFATRTALADPSVTPIAHIRLERNVKSRLFGNTFKNTRSWNSGVTSRGNGIQMVNCNAIHIKDKEAYEINGTPSTASCQFRDLEYGIKSTGTLATDYISVENVYFRDNANAISVANATDLRLVNNNIRVNSSIQGIIYPTYGIYLDGCDQYTVENNTVEMGQFGIYVSNSGMGNNEVYRNTVTGSRVSMSSHGENSDFDPALHESTKGLQFRCNNLGSYHYAVSVPVGNMHTSQGILNGETDQLAGNTFDHNSSYATGDFNASDMNAAYKYYHHQNYVTHIPNRSSNTNAFLENQLYDPNASCPDNQVRSTKASLSAIESAYESTGFGISSKEGELQALTDDGNTLLLKAKAEMMDAGNYPEMLNALDQEGFLSDEVLDALMENTSAPAAAKCMSLIDNSPLPAKQKVKIDEMTDVPEGLRNILKQYQDGVNARELKEMEISRLKNQKHKLLGRALQFYFDNDALSLQADSARNFITELPVALSYRERFALYVAEEDYTAAGNVLETMETYALEHADQGLANEIALQRIALNLDQGIAPMDSLLQANLSFLDEMAGDTLTKASVQARLILNLTGDTAYHECLLEPVVPITPRRALNDAKNTAECWLDVYPNPADDVCFVEYAFVSDDSPNLRIFDAEGRLMEARELHKPAGLIRINTSDYKPGVYIIQLKGQSLKLTVQ